MRSPVSCASAMALLQTIGAGSQHEHQSTRSGFFCRFGDKECDSAHSPRRRDHATSDRPEWRSAPGGAARPREEPLSRPGQIRLGMRLSRGEVRPSHSPLQRLLRPPGRQTNQALLVVLLFAFGTGVATVAIGSPDGAWVAIGHGICGTAVVLLIPWKSRVVRGGLRRARLSRWLSLLLAALALVTLIAGFGYATGLVRSIAGKAGLWVHIAVALTLVPLVVWHVWARGIRPRRSDLSRRALLRAGVLAVGAAGLYAAAEAAISGLMTPGARRRFTGSYETASFRPEAMPSTSWLLDAVPTVDPDRWRLTI